MTRYALVTATGVDQRCEPSADRPVAKPERLRRAVQMARRCCLRAYIVTAEEAERCPLARTLERRLAARPPADPDLPLALAPRRGPRTVAVGADRRVSLRLPADLLARVDAARGEEPASVWWRRAAEAALGPAEESS